MQIMITTARGAGHEISGVTQSTNMYSNAGDCTAGNTKLQKCQQTVARPSQRLGSTQITNQRPSSFGMPGSGHPYQLCCQMKIPYPNQPVSCQNFRHPGPNFGQ